MYILQTFLSGARMFVLARVTAMLNSKTTCTSCSSYEKAFNDKENDRQSSTAHLC